MLVREVVTLNASAGLFIDLASKALLFSVFFTTYAERMDSKIIIWMVFLFYFSWLLFISTLDIPPITSLSEKLSRCLACFQFFYHFRRGSFRIGLITSFAMLVLSGSVRRYWVVFALSPHSFSDILVEGVFG